MTGRDFSDRGVSDSGGCITPRSMRRLRSGFASEAWTAAVDPDGGVHQGGDVAETTALLDLTGWPTGMRVIVRRERPQPGAHLSLFEQADEYRYQAVATNSAAEQFSVPARPATAPMPGSRTASDTRRTPAWDGSLPRTSRSTRHGPSSLRSAQTSSLGCGCSP